MAGETSADCENGANGAPPAGRTTKRQERSSTLFAVGVEASAGGPEALERVFRAVPADSGMAFVVVRRLAMGHRSVMPEFAAKLTAMPVRQSEDRGRHAIAVALSGTGSDGSAGFGAGAGRRGGW